MKARIFSTLGVIGIIATFIVAVTTFSSKDYLYFAPFVTIGILLSIIILALGEILAIFETREKTKKLEEMKNEEKQN